MSEREPSSGDVSKENYSIKLSELKFDQCWRAYQDTQKKLLYYLEQAAADKGYQANAAVGTNSHGIIDSILIYQVAPMEDGKEVIAFPKLYGDWFEGLRKSRPDMTLGDFVRTYGPEAFPEIAEELFQQIVPKETVDGFLRKCLNVADTETDHVVASIEASANAAVDTAERQNAA